MIPISFVETATPLRWPLLIHELGHWLLPGGRSLADIARPELRKTLKEDPLSSQTEAIFAEVFADQVAYRSCGLAYAYALASEAALSGEEAHHTGAASAPNVLTRLEMIGDQVREWAADLPQEWFDAPPQDQKRARDISAVVTGLLEDYPPVSVRENVVQ